ncbi:hypothetical protein [Actinomycetospora straminea]|uniref:Uncharacterized protein n=1 Tax=Actinomycetospora straminea TaxID=663607 RepID=A0ABP9E8K4_9PSEU|nr:hypothetical protein [Actinomycetospora straminea]MDD7931926.1 hypothetical protein [Actinomycetospora straminea]
MTLSQTASAHTALREATQALSVRRDDGDTELSVTDHQALATDLADTLDAIASLLRSVGVGVQADGTGHGLPAVAEYVDRGALMARRASGNQDGDVPEAAHLDPERCGTADD